MRFFAQVSLLLASSLLSCQAAISYIEAFQNIQSDVVWPAPFSNAHNISSTFGPRIRSSCNCYDFHRGIDIHGEIGDNVTASYDGVVEKITTYADGGKTVILKHSFADWVTLVPNQGNTKVWYTLYLHLDEWLVSEGDQVNAGDLIAYMGDSGSTVTPHLHHEVRVGTRCSLEYALDNPSSTCNTKGYDPHVHPLLVYPADAVGPSDVTVEVSSNITANIDGVITVTTADDAANVNKYHVAIVDTNTGTTRKEHTLDLNLRYGFDASSTSALDTPDTTKPYLNPDSFGYSASEWAIELVIPSSWVSSKLATEEYVVTVTDIWGGDTAVTFGINDVW